jgi:AraC family transcriptional regulator, regulatory protein of adaptative response / DNA-3-methyladenine glycosylase II
MQLDRRACDHARRSRDARFDGRFFTAVTTTGIYCRPICPARASKDEHVRYFPTAAAAEAAGFRPCRRCRPEASPGTPAWAGTSGVVSRALRLIGEGALDGASVERLAARLGVTARHLRRLFLQHLGATPLDVALTRRAHFAKKLLDETTLPFDAVALASGFGSRRRFNGQIRRTFHRTPRELRRRARHPAATEPGCYRFRLAYRPPYDWEAVLAFLGARAIPGVERVELAEPSRYRRTIVLDGNVGFLSVGHVPSAGALELEVRFPDPRRLLLIVERVRRLFDLGADPRLIAEHLGADPLLREAMRRRPGVRVPGAWDGFELAVRAIVGQQVSVAAASTIAGRIARRFGSPAAGADGLERAFPPAARLVHAAIEQAGVMPSRGEAIRCLARHVARGRISLGAVADTRATLAALIALPGIGAWTAQYVAMRALGEPDAFPSGDLVLRRMAGAATGGELERRSQAWRPWRAYAVMLLWQQAAEAPRRKHAQPTGRGLRDGRPPALLGEAR